MSKKQFKAESKRLLDMMIHSIYTNREIFLRELISNASDALDKRHYLSLTDNRYATDSSNLKITLTIHKDTRQLIIEDTGVGMSQEELEKNLGTIARSGSAEFRKQLEENVDNVDIIGQFGVGFYSAFIVAKHVLVETKSAASDKAYSWSSTGEDGYTINEIEKPEIGTRITIDLKDNSEEENFDEFLEEYKIRELVKKYSDYVRYPIQMEVTKSIPDPTDAQKTIDTKELETLNSMIPLWKKSKSSITQEEYNSFYKAKFNDWEDPQKVIHYSVEGTLSYTALLFIPSKTPYNFYYQDFEPGLQLYSKSVFILDKAKDLVPDYYRFVQGIIDSDDLNLNISREILQQDRQVKILAKSIEKKIQASLEDMLKNDRDNYEKFFDNFGLNLKYGIYQDYGLHKDQLQDLIMFRSSKEGKYVTLKEYTDRMPTEQKSIYYAVGSSIDEIEQSPIMPKLKKKGYEVLYFLDQRDEFVTGILQNYAEKNFVSISQANLDLDSEEEKKEIEEKTEQNKDLLTAMKDALDGKVKEVRISSRLVDDPVCIVADEGVSLDMERFLANDPMNKDRAVTATKILEINPNHPIFTKLQEVSKTSSDKLKEYTDVLYDQALLIEGLPIKNPVEFAKKIANLIVDAK